MRRLLSLLFLPLLAAPPANLKILRANVTWGAGVEPKGKLAPSRFQAELSLVGHKLPAKADFRAWHVKSTDMLKLQRGVSARNLYQGKGLLESTTTASGEGTWNISGTWPDSPKPEDRLLVEVWSGKRRLAWAATPLEERLIPTTGQPASEPREE